VKILSRALFISLAAAASAGLGACASEELPSSAVAQTVVLNAEAKTHERYVAVALTRPSTKSLLTSAEITTIHDFVVNHPVAALAQLAKYDPTGAIGFCFGRSTAVTLSARVLGLDSTKIRQLFVVGDLRSSADPEWRFHVTTLVDSKDGWIAIDPIMPTPLPMQAWIDRVSKTWDKKGKAAFYMTPFDTILPDLTVVPDVAAEKGENLIELSFAPASKPGFTKADADGKTLFNVTESAAQSYFMTSTETSRFKFDKITINGGDFDYLGYFSDLLADMAPRNNLSSGVPFRAAQPSNSTRSAAHVAWPPLGLNLRALKK